MIKNTSQRSARRTILGLALLMCGAALVLGLGLDLVSGENLRFWIDQRPGVIGLVGAATSIVIVVIAQLTRALIGRPVEGEAKRDTRDADA
jgi:hypothetical protein